MKRSSLLACVISFALLLLAGASASARPADGLLAFLPDVPPDTTPQGSGQAPVPSPEPSTVVLAGLGSSLVAAGSWRRWRKRHANGALAS